MPSVVSIKFKEALHLDFVQIEDMYKTLGKVQAEELICRAFECLAVEVDHLDQVGLYEDAVIKQIMTNIISEASNIGLQDMAEMALNVLDCIETGDRISLAATLLRLKRASDPLLSSETFGCVLP